jgi:hypothetical protein
LPNTVYEAQVSVDCGGGDLSGFTFSYTFQTSCGLTACPVGAINENEPCGDDLNGGCNMAVPNYEQLLVVKLFVVLLGHQQQHVIQIGSLLH